MHWKHDSLICGLPSIQDEDPMKSYHWILMKTKANKLKHNQQVKPKPKIEERNNGIKVQDQYWRTRVYVLGMSSKLFKYHLIKIKTLQVSLRVASMIHLRF